MGIQQGLLASVTGIKIGQFVLGVDGNDLANGTTTAFKGSRVSFQDAFSQTLRGASKPTTNSGGLNPIQNGLGVILASTDVSTEQGALNATYRNTDVAVQGDGWLMFSDGEELFYSRDGNLDVDSGGNLIHRATGKRVLGWQADASGNIDNTQAITTASTLSIPKGTLPTAQVTSKVSFGGNLNSQSAATDVVEVPFLAYDSLGTKHNLVLQLTNKQSPATGTAPTGATSSWEWSVLEGTTSIAAHNTGSNQRLYFNSSGALLNPSTIGTVTVPAAAPAGAFTFNLDLANIGQLNTESQVTMTSQDGFAPGYLQDFKISGDGTLIGRYTTGLTRPIAQIVMATFANSGGLERSGGNLWRGTDNAGVPVVGPPGSGGRGSLVSGFLEQSNIDVSDKFSNIIITQRFIQSNARVVTASDEIAQEIINMKR